MVPLFRLKGPVTFAVALSMLNASSAGAVHDVSAQQQQPAVECRTAEPSRSRARPFARTDLFFGTAKPGGVVTDEEFRAFIDEEVTPRFPDGLTVLKGDGQFKGSDGVIVKEQSFVLILLYASDAYMESSQKIDRISGLYTQRFQQESVFRLDDPLRCGSHSDGRTAVTRDSAAARGLVRSTRRYVTIAGKGMSVVGRLWSGT